MTAPSWEVSDVRPWLAPGLLVVLLAWESAAPFFPFPKCRPRLRHGLRNIALGVLNAAATALAFSALWWWAAGFSETHSLGLIHRLPLSEPLAWLAAILLLDVWTYYWHRINHRLPFLWRFHRVHHSDPHMDVTTANRFHIGEIVISSLLRVPLILLLGIQLGQLALYELLMFAVVQFHHANIALPAKADRILSWFIVTPFMHKVHHSRWRPETDSNYSSLLSVWDRIFRSFRTSDDPRKLRLGLDEFDDPASQTLAGLFKTPASNRKRR